MTTEIRTQETNVESRAPGEGVNIADAAGSQGPGIVERRTRETAVRVRVGFGPPEGAPAGAIQTTEPFLSHMLHTLARYAELDIQVEATGDLRHHVIEDVAIAMGRAIATGQAPAIARYGACTIPMDDALVQVVLDLGGRAYYRGPLPSTLYDHWMRSFAENARATLHVRVIRGRDRHHVIEAAFKALGVALGTALRPAHTTLSTKGRVQW